MSRGYYRRLAKTNISKNGKVYFPYMVTGVICVMMSYLLKSLSINPGFKEMIGFEAMTMTMGYACWVARIFIVIFILYTNSFLVKRRKKEFGVFHILGMEKKHLSLVLFMETLYTLFITLAAGLLFGIAMDKLMFMIILRMLDLEIPVGFFVSSETIISTMILFAGIYFIVFLMDVIQIHAAKPVELLHGSEVGEKEPKVKWLLALIGIVSLAAGYYLALTTKDPLASLNVFFVAVLLVIFGTYCLFTAGSIAVLKLLKKNKKYYYKTKHFASVSGLLYRMKQNAAGLASICILSTMVLVTVSFTSTMMIGFEGVLRSRYPMDLGIYCYGNSEEDIEATTKEIRQKPKEAGLKVSEEVSYRFLSFCALQKGEAFSTDVVEIGSAVSNIANLVFLPLEDYNAMMGENYTLSEDEILVAGCRDSYRKDKLRVLDYEFTVKQEILDSKKIPKNGKMMADMVDTFFVVVRDSDALWEIYQKQAEAYGENASPLRSYYGCNTKSSRQEEIAFYDNIAASYTPQAADVHWEIECREADRISIKSLYGGLFFVGVFLGSLFLMATVLIIYYKQISEGYDDKRRFTIMQQVGMTEKEVSETIRSQVLTVFFMPLIVAGIHLAFAYPLLTQLLSMFNLTDEVLFVKCLVGCFLVFALIYVWIYHVTAKTYHRIVKD